ncbi:hypothetical protein CRV08_00610 [Halarcobacter ebronensis]|uniref:Peptidase n=1 Tax=Halarcobacter ebronensis TaxID=1462615 RepID=A0A4Q0YHI3_9BACT|nr:PepSY-associated TM helix domain-containing protein [Halarcobacter ebronensis]RXJ70097.1 hypothetical protein CRV08_00610 [Halarcobacter ebronensis]
MKKSLSNMMRSLHRDLGYFFIGVTLLYSITGFILSARGLGWFKVEYNFTTFISKDIQKDQFKKQLIVEAKNGKFDKIYTKETFKAVEKNIKNLEYKGEENYILHFNRSGKFDIKYNQITGESQIKYKDYPPYLKLFTNTHMTNNENVWFYLALVYSVVLAFFAISAMFIVKGKYGFKRRGVYLTSLGFLTVFIFIYFSFYN